MKSLVVGIFISALASLGCPGKGLCQTADETATPGAADAEEQPAQEEPVYDPSKPIPAGYVLEKRPHPALLIPGGVTLGASYAYGLFIAVSMRQDPNRATFNPGWLLIPVLGPLIATATEHDNCGPAGWGSRRNTYCVHPDRGLVVLGGIQAIGLVLAAASYQAPRKRLVRATVTLAPVPIGLDGYGFSLSGRL
jgi:hypothetical protein